MPCKKEDTRTGVCEARYSVVPNVLEELYNLMPRGNFIIANGGCNEILTLRCRRTRFCCVFIGMYLKYAVVF